MGLADRLPEPEPADRLTHAATLQASVVIRNTVRVVSVHPAERRRIELVHVADRLVAETALEQLLDQIIGVFHAALGTWIARLVRDMRHLQGM